MSSCVEKALVSLLEKNEMHAYYILLINVCVLKKQNRPVGH